MQSFRALFQEVQISSLIDWKPSDFTYIPKVLNIVTEYKTCGSKLNFVANGEVRIVVEGKKLDRHNLVLTKSIFAASCFLSSYLGRHFSFLSIDRVA